ncbi:MAG: AMP-binding protein [Gammaproteobacteria bacterium]
MIATERQSGYVVNFSSTEDIPLAFSSGSAISLGKFRQDVLQNSERLTDKGDVLISCHGRYAFSVALLAAWLAEKTVILPPDTLNKTRATIHSHCCIAHEFDAAWSESLLPEEATTRHGNWSVTLSPETSLQLFTSGSTGEPKAITKTIGNLLDEAITLSEQFDWPDSPIVGSVTPNHLYGLTFTILLPWILQLPWVDDIPLFPGDIVNTLKQTGSRTLISIPTQYKALLQDTSDLSHLVCISAAAPLFADLSAQWKQRNNYDILEIYGSTETGIIAHRRQSITTAWNAFPNVSLSTEKGLLKICSPFVSPTWAMGFQTADRVTLESDRSFQLLGRADAIVKIAGKRVSLSKIEKRLLSCEGVAEAVVVAVPETGHIRDSSIWAAVTAKKQHKLTSRQLQEDLRGQLEGIEIPRRIVITDTLPRTANGKLPLDAIKILFNSDKPQHV